MSATHNLIIEQGATWQLSLTWKINGSPVDLTAYSARLQARKTYESATAVLNLTSDDAITLGDEAGTIVIDLTDEETAAIHAGQYVWDIELEDDQGNVTRLLEGAVKVTPEVTR